MGNKDFGCGFWEIADGRSRSSTAPKDSVSGRVWAGVGSLSSLRPVLRTISLHHIGDFITFHHIFSAPLFHHFITFHHILHPFHHISSYLFRTTTSSLHPFHHILFRTTSSHFIHFILLYFITSSHFIPPLHFIPSFHFISSSYFIHFSC